MIGNLVFSVITIISSSFFLIVSLLNPIRSRTFIGPNGWPNAVLVFTLIMGIIQLVKAIINIKKANINIKELIKVETKEKTGNKVYDNNHWIILGALAIYIFMLSITGFIITTAILFAFLSWTFGMRSKVKILVSTLVSNVLFIILFAHLLNIPIPRGVGIFETISFFLY